MKNKELKTLKDFTTRELEGMEKRVSEKVVEDIKAEAVKWVKDMREPIIKSGVQINEYFWKEISWIMMFFNLTEEDLK